MSKSNARSANRNLCNQCQMISFRKIFTNEFTTEDETNTTNSWMIVQMTTNGTRNVYVTNATAQILRDTRRRKQRITNSDYRYGLKITARPISMTNHKRWTFTNLKYITCKQCHWSFALSGYKMLTHMNTHKHNLQRHRAILHNQ